jgi:hypothetical protein
MTTVSSQNLARNGSLATTAPTTGCYAPALARRTRLRRHRHRHAAPDSLRIQIPIRILLRLGQYSRVAAAPAVILRYISAAVSRASRCRRRCRCRCRPFLPAAGRSPVARSSSSRCKPAADRAEIAGKLFTHEAPIGYGCLQRGNIRHIYIEATHFIVNN